MFQECTNLTNVTIPNGVTSIGAYAFSSCKSLTSVTIPSSVTSIGDRAFIDCTGLTSVTIPSGVTSIGEAAFANCKSLTSVTFEGTTNLGSDPFYGDLRAKYLAGGIGTYTRAGGNLATWTKQVTDTPITTGNGNVTINFWINGDNQILTSNSNVTISRSGGQSSFNASVTSAYTNIQWYVNGLPVSGTQSITINAMNYLPGTYRLGVVVYRNSVPYSTEIRFTVTN